MSPMFPSYVLCPMSMFSSVITNKVFMCHQHAYTPQITHCLTHTVSHHSSRVPLGSSRHLWWRPFRGSKGHYLFLVKHVVVLHACLVFLVPLHHLLQHGMLQGKTTLLMSLLCVLEGNIENIVGHCWTLLDIVGHWWTLVDIVGHCWTLADMREKHCWTWGDMRGHGWT